MASFRSLVRRIRAAIAAGALMLSVGGGAFMVGPEVSDNDVIRIGAFNIQVFGKTKAAKDSVMDVLVRIVREFDVVVVQEIRDSREQVADRFLDRINSMDGFHYRMLEGPRLGRTSSKEQYVVYYTPATVELMNAYTQPDPDDAFEREPLVATFRSNNFDFTLIACHIKPDDAEDELTTLATVARATLGANPAERDLILLGDFNADCRYFDEDDPNHALRDADFHWLIADSMETAIITGCTYDRIIVFDETFSSEFIEGSAQVFRFDEEFDLTDEEFVREVSDHYPVMAEFVTSAVDDD